MVGCFVLRFCVQSTDETKLRKDGRKRTGGPEKKLRAFPFLAFAPNTIAFHLAEREPSLESSMPSTSLIWCEGRLRSSNTKKVTIARERFVTTFSSKSNITFAGQKILGIVRLSRLFHFPILRNLHSTNVFS